MKIGYVVLCLLVPLFWGLASARLFDWWQTRRKPTPVPPEDTAKPDAPASGDMYHI